MQGPARGGLGWQWGQRFRRSLSLCRPGCCLLLPRGGSRGPPLSAPEPCKAAAALSWPGRRGPVETWKAPGCRHSRWQRLQSSPMTLRGATGTHHRPLCVQGQRSLREERGGLGALQEAGYLRLPGPTAPRSPWLPQSCSDARRCPVGTEASSTISRGSLNLCRLRFLICGLGVEIPTARNEKTRTKPPGMKQVLNRSIQYAEGRSLSLPNKHIKTQFVLFG